MARASNNRALFGITSGAIDLAAVPWTGNLTAFTIGVRIDVGSGNNANEGIFGNWHTTGHRILWRDNSGTIQLYIYDGTNQRGPATISTGSANTLAWKFARWDGTNLQVFRDTTAGTSASTSGVTSLPAASAAAFAWGQSPNGSGSQVAPGMYMQTGFFCTHALTDAAIASIVAGAHPMQFAPRHYWPMDESTGSVAIDLLGGNNGTLDADTTWSTAGSQGKPYYQRVGAIIPFASTATPPAPGPALNPVLYRRTNTLLRM